MNWPLYHYEMTLHAPGSSSILNSNFSDIRIDTLDNLLASFSMMCLVVFFCFNIFVSIFNVHFSKAYIVRSWLFSYLIICLLIGVFRSFTFILLITVLFKSVILQYVLLLSVLCSLFIFSIFFCLFDFCILFHGV